MRARRFALLTFAGFVLVQAIWILTVPPFRGIDEFDHAYRASGVAHGQWRLTEFAENGRGLVVEVPATLVRAASAQCDSLPYTGSDNCFPIESQGQGRVTVATAAGLYNPAWYAVIGYPSAPFDGSSALYVMRLTTALLCAIGVALSAWVLGLTRPGPWTRLGFTVALTPILIYSTVIPAPNGPEMVAGLLLWTSLTALLRAESSQRRPQTLFALACLAALVLATLRTLGPMWLGLILISVIAVAGRDAALQSLRAHPRMWTSSTLLVSVSVLAGAWWTVNAGLTDTSPDIVRDGPAELAFGLNPVVWLLQMIAAFPLRGDAASPAVYLCFAGVLGLLIVAGGLKARGRVRVAVWTMVAVVVLAPMLITALTFQSQGVIWQGRYQLAWAVGVPLVACRVLDERGFLAREGVKVRLILSALIGVGHAWSVWGLAAEEQQRATSAGDSSWVTTSPALLAICSLVAALGWVVLATRSTTDHGDLSREGSRPGDSLSHREPREHRRNST